MTSETPFRIPSAPEQLERISPRRQFMQLHAKANTEASVATARGVVFSLGGLSFIGAMSYLMIPIILSHDASGAHHDVTCVCELTLLVAVVTGVGVLISTIRTARPLRKKFKHLEGLISKVQNFNVSIIRMNSDIRNFDKFSHPVKRAVIDCAMNLSRTRENILVELETAHE